MYIYTIMVYLIYANVSVREPDLCCAEYSELRRSRYKSYLTPHRALSVRHHPDIYIDAQPSHLTFTVWLCVIILM